VSEHCSHRHSSSALEGHSKWVTQTYRSKLAVGVELGLVLKVET